MILKKREVNANSLANLKPFGPGNPGRPKGSRNKLGEAFIEDLYADWQEHGQQALKDCREQNPAAYVKTVANLLPKDINLNVNVAEQLTDDEIAVGLDAVRAAIAARKAVSDSGGEDTAH
jgi:hypothetical protein